MQVNSGFICYNVSQNALWTFRGNLVYSQPGYRSRTSLVYRSFQVIATLIFFCNMLFRVEKPHKIGVNVKPNGL